MHSQAEGTALPLSSTVPGTSSGSPSSVRVSTRKHIKKLSPIRLKADATQHVVTNGSIASAASPNAFSSTKSKESTAVASLVKASQKPNANSSHPCAISCTAINNNNGSPSGGYHLTPLMRNDLDYLHKLMDQAIAQQNLPAMEEVLDALLSYMESHQRQYRAVHDDTTRRHQLELLRKYEQEIVTLQHLNQQQEQQFRANANLCMQQLVLKLATKPLHQHQPHEIERLCHHAQELYRSAKDPRYKCISFLYEKFLADDLLLQANHVFESKGDISAAIALAKQAQQHFQAFCNSSHHQQALVLLSVSQAQPKPKQHQPDDSHVPVPAIAPAPTPTPNPNPTPTHRPSVTTTTKDIVLTTTTTTTTTTSSSSSTTSLSGAQDWSELLDMHERELADMKTLFDDGVERYFEQMASNQLESLKKQMQSLVDQKQFPAAKQMLQQIQEICVFFHLQLPKHLDKWHQKIQSQKMAHEKQMFQQQVLDPLQKQLDQLTLWTSTTTSPSTSHPVGSMTTWLLPSLTSLNDFQLAVPVETWLRELVTDSAARLLLHDHNGPHSGVMALVLKALDYDAQIQRCFAAGCLTKSVDSVTNSSVMMVHAASSAASDFAGVFKGKTRFLTAVLTLVETFQTRFTSCMNESSTATTTIDVVLLGTGLLRILQLVEDQDQKKQVLELLERQIHVKQTLFLLLHKTNLLDQLMALKETDGNHMELMLLIVQIVRHIASTSFPQFIGSLKKNPRVVVVVQQICGRFMKNMAIVTCCLVCLARICQSDPVGAAGGFLKVCENGFCATLRMLAEKYIVPLKKLAKPKKAASVPLSSSSSSSSSSHPPTSPGQGAGSKSPAANATNNEMDDPDFIQQLVQIQELVHNLVVLVYLLCIGDPRAAKTLGKDKVIHVLCQKSGVLTNWLTWVPPTTTTSNDATTTPTRCGDDDPSHQQEHELSVKMLQLFMPKTFDELVEVQTASTVPLDNGVAVQPPNATAALIDFLMTKKLPSTFLMDSTAAEQQQVLPLKTTNRALVRFALVVGGARDKKQAKTYQLAKAQFGADGVTCTLELFNVSGSPNDFRISSPSLTPGLYSLKAARSAVDAFHKAMKGKNAVTRTQVFMEMKSAFAPVKQIRSTTTTTRKTTTNLTS